MTTETSQSGLSSTEIVRSLLGDDLYREYIVFHSTIDDAARAHYYTSEESRELVREALKKYPCDEVRRYLYTGCL